VRQALFWDLFPAHIIIGVFYDAINSQAVEAGHHLYRGNKSGTASRSIPTLDIG